MRHGCKIVSIATVLIGGVASSIASAQTSACAASADSLFYADIETLQQRISERRLTASQLTDRFIARIRACDHAGPTVRAVVELNPESSDIAATIDRSTSKGRLHGMPILIKDNIDTGDRMLTSIGSLALTRPAAHDAEVVKRLRNAGAVVLGKTNVSEWVNFRSRHGVSGWSARGGQTRNPYVLDRSPCSSSAGSAAAVAAGFAVAAIGTETDGSIICPASLNGIVGIKPTRGLVSRAGVIPLAPSFDTVGPMARSVADAVAVLNVIAGSDTTDTATEQADRHVTDFRRFLSVRGLEGKRIGVLRAFMGAEPNADRTLESALELMKRQGAIVIDDVTIAHASELPALKSLIARYEFKHHIDRYLAARADPGVKSLADVIAFNRAESARELRWFDQATLEQSQGKGPLTDPAYIEALAKVRRLSQAEGIDAALLQHELDALVAPTWGPAFTIDSVYGDPDIEGPSTPAAVAGYPSITVPAGFAHELPVGIVFIGTQWSEPTLISIAYAFEQHAHAWRPPRFLRTIDD